MWSGVETGKPTDAVFKHDNHTGRWVSPFRAVWAPAGDAFVVGSLKRATEARTHAHAHAPHATRHAPRATRMRTCTQCFFVSRGMHATTPHVDSVHMWAISRNPQPHSSCTMLHARIER